MKRVKSLDPENVAADLFAAELELFVFNAPDKAMAIFSSLPKEKRICLATLEYDKVRRAGPIDVPEMLVFMTAIRNVWKSSLEPRDFETIERVLNFNPSKQKIIDFKSKDIDRVRNHLAVISNCGTMGDSLAHFLVAYFKHHADFRAEADLMEAHLQKFPFSPDVDFFSMINSALLLVDVNPGQSALMNVDTGFVLKDKRALEMVKNFNSFYSNQEYLIERYEKIRSNFHRRFGARQESSLQIPIETIRDWIDSDLKSIIDLLESHGITVVFMTYPPIPTPAQDKESSLSAQVADAEIRKVAAESKVRFFDTYTLVRQRLLEKADPKAFFSNEYGPTDTHLNASGYSIVASLLFDYLEKEKLILKK
jgi:hypothetical protein